MTQPPKDYFAFQMRVLRLIGINMIDIKHPVHRVLYNMYAIFIFFFTFILYTLVEFLAIFDYLSDLKTSTFILCYGLSHFLGCVKAVLVYLNRKNIKKYIKSLEESIFRPNMQRGGKKEIEIIKNAIWVSRTQANFFYLMAVLIVGNGLISAAIEPSSVETKYDAKTNANVTVLVRRLPWIIWTCFDKSATPYYQIIFAYQGWCAWWFGVLVGMLDTLVTGLLVHLNAQFAILKNSIENVLERARTYGNESVNMHPGFQYQLLGTECEYVPRLTPTVNKRLHTYMAECLDHHNKIIDLSNNVEKQFNILILIQFLGSTLICCFQLFHLSFVPLVSFTFMSMGAYMTLMLFQLGIYCYNGNEVSLQSEQICAAAYNMDWFGADDELKRVLLLMMVRAQRPVRISAGKFAFLSMETFMNIVRGSFSYFMVLHQMNG